MSSTRAAQQQRTRAVDVSPESLAQIEAPHPMAKLQAQVGNAGLVDMLARAQPKLVVGSAHDPAEVEADAAARQVVASLGVQRGEGGGHQCAPTCSHSGGTVARSAIGMAGGDLDTDSSSKLQSAMGGGSPLPVTTRRQMEGAFNADFSSVRVHADEQSSQLARSMSARAFTVGGHIFLGGGQRTDNHELMAHELTHTIQQGASKQQPAG